MHPALAGLGSGNALQDRIRTPIATRRRHTHAYHLGMSILPSRAATGQRLSRATTSCTSSPTAQINAANLGAKITSGTTAPNTSSIPPIVLVKP